MWVFHFDNLYSRMKSSSEVVTWRAAVEIDEQTEQEEEAHQ